MRHPTQRAREAEKDQHQALVDWPRRAEASAGADQGRLGEEFASPISELGEFSRRHPSPGQAEAKLVEARVEKAYPKPESGPRPAPGLSNASGLPPADAANKRL